MRKLSPGSRRGSESPVPATGLDRCDWLGLRCPVRRADCSESDGGLCIYVVMATSNRTVRQAAPALAAVAVLSQREREVLREFLLDGSSEDTAKTLSISLHTVRNHFKAIFRKLEVGSQVELLRQFQHIASVL